MTHTLKDVILYVDDYLTAGRYNVEDWQRNNQLSLQVRDAISSLDVTVATDVYRSGELNESTFPYPNIDPNSVGRTVPLAYGYVWEVPGVVIDTSEGKIKFLGRDCLSILEVRVDGISLNASTLTKDLTKSEVIWSEWDDEDQPGTITADIYVSSDNAVDVFSAIMTQIGITDVATLTTVREEYVRGTTIPYANEEQGPSISLYVNDTRSALETLNTLCKTAFMLLYIDADQNYAVRAWETQVGHDATVFRSHDVISMSNNTQSSRIVSAVNVGWKRRHSSNSEQVLYIESDDIRDARGFSQHVSGEVESLPIWRRTDAVTWGSRWLAIEGQPLETYTLQMHPRASSLLPGDSIMLTYDQMEFENEQFEVLGVTITPLGGGVELTVGRWRQFRERSGYWVGDSETFPVSLGGGTMAAWDNTWTDDQKKYAGQNSGFWTDDNGQLDSDPEGIDRSVWI